jgi:outer membrane protein assembly factor BamD (BamD/ComL family)
MVSVREYQNALEALAAARSSRKQVESSDDAALLAEARRRETEAQWQVEEVRWALKLLLEDLKTEARVYADALAEAKTRAGKEPSSMSAQEMAARGRAAHEASKQLAEVLAARSPEALAGRKLALPESFQKVPIPLAASCAVAALLLLGLTLAVKGAVPSGAAGVVGRMLAVGLALAAGVLPFVLARQQRQLGLALCTGASAVLAAVMVLSFVAGSGVMATGGAAYAAWLVPACVIVASGLWLTRAKRGLLLASLGAIAGAVLIVTGTATYGFGLLRARLSLAVECRREQGESPPWRQLTVAVENAGLEPARVTPNAPDGGSPGWVVRIEKTDRSGSWSPARDLLRSVSEVGAEGPAEGRDGVLLEGRRQVQFGARLRCGIEGRSLPEARPGSYRVVLRGPDGNVQDQQGFEVEIVPDPAWRLYTAGKVAFDEGDLVEAVRKLGALTSMHPKSHWASPGAGLLDRAHDARTAKAALEQAGEAAKLGRTDEAIETLEKAARQIRRPQGEGAARIEAEIDRLRTVQSEQYAEALKDVQELLQAGRYDEAETKCRTLAARAEEGSAAARTVERLLAQIRVAQKRAAADNAIDLKDYEKAWRESEAIREVGTEAAGREADQIQARVRAALAGPYLKALQDDGLPFLMHRLAADIELTPARTVKREVLESLLEQMDREYEALGITERGRAARGCLERHRTDMAPALCRRLQEDVDAWQKRERDAWEALVRCAGHSSRGSFQRFKRAYVVLVEQFAETQAAAQAQRLWPNGRFRVVKPDKLRQAMPQRWE